MPDIFGRPRSITATSKGTSRPMVQALVAVAGGIDGESLALQSRGQGLAQGGFVFDQ